MTVSVIIPTRNRPDYLREAVASVLAQTFQDFELIIVNDGLLPVPAFSDPRIQVLSSNQSGAVAARNLGVSEARGETLLWLDDDDVWSDPGFLATCDEYLRQGSSFIFGDGEMVFPNGEQKLFSQNADLDSLQRDNTILISAVCYRADLHHALGAFDSALPYYWDWDWYLRVTRARHELTHLARPVVKIRIHAQNMSGDENAAARQANLQLLCNKHDLPPLPLKSHVDFL